MSLATRLLHRRKELITAETPLDGGLTPNQTYSADDLTWRSVVASIDRALAILAARQAAGVKTLDLQLVVQACPPGPHYARWRKDRHRLFQRSNKALGTSQWPEQLPRNHFALLLLPYPAGKVGAALAGAKLQAEPMFIRPIVKDDIAWLDLMAAQLIRSWLHWTPADMTVAAAPPVLEELRLGRLHARRLFDCGLRSWPLPPPDGLTLPR